MHHPLSRKTPPLSLGLLVSFLTLASAVADELSPAELTPGELEIRKHLPAEEFDLTTLRLWPGEAPDEPHPYPDELVSQADRGPQIRSVSLPSITIARPKSAIGPTCAVVVCPGGGYGGLGITEGGVDIINWLKPQGVTGVYLKYRVPKRHQGFPQHHHATQDIQRAISLLRGRAAELGIDPRRIGVIGFSAGGHLCAMSATHHRPEDRLYEPVDASDKASCRPDFVALVAPAYLTSPILSDQLDPALNADQVARNLTPPVFIASAVNDKFTVGALHFLLVLREKRVPVEAHIYEQGGHAQGIHDGPDNQWPRMFADWMRRRGLLDSAPR